MKKIKLLTQGVALAVCTLIPGRLSAQEEGVAAKGVEAVRDVAVQQMDTARNLIEVLIEFCVKYSFQVIGGVIVLILGWMVAGYVTKTVLKFLASKNVDITVSKFIGGTVKLSIVMFAVIVAMGKFGIEIAPLIAGISVIGFGTSFALQGTLSNYAAGISLIFAKPFKVGEIVEVAGEMGEVLDIKLSRTEMRTVDGDLVIIPNKHIVGEIIHNYSTLKRLDVNVGVSYGGDIDKALGIVKDVIKKESRINQKKGPYIGISEFADSSVNIYGRVWCLQKEYWSVKFDVNKKIFEEFGLQGVEIPFPQRDVHLIGEGVPEGVKV